MSENQNSNGSKTAPATAKSNEPKKDFVQLKKKNGKDKEGREFPIAQANALLKLPNAQWELSDETKYQWNGVEISKK